MRTRRPERRQGDHRRAEKPGAPHNVPARLRRRRDDPDHLGAGAADRRKRRPERLLPGALLSEPGRRGHRSRPDDDAVDHGNLDLLDLDHRSRGGTRRNRTDRIHRRIGGRNRWRRQGRSADDLALRRSGQSRRNRIRQPLHAAEVAGEDVRRRTARLRRRRRNADPEPEPLPLRRRSRSGSRRKEGEGKVSEQEVEGQGYEQADRVRDRAGLQPTAEITRRIARTSSATPRNFLIVGPVKRRERRAPSWAPGSTPIERAIARRSPWPTEIVPPIRGVALAVPAIQTRTKCEVAVAMWGGKPSAPAISGTWMTPPPIPRKLERKPTPAL